MKNILITGSEGFIGKNLRIKLERQNFINLFLFSKKDSFNDLKAYIKNVDIIFHLAGENRSKNENDFELNNTNFTRKLCELIEENYNTNNKRITIIFSSTIKVEEETAYGKSKLKSEECLKNLSRKYNLTLIIYRLSNVFGKWSKPNYNSAIATFCHNISRNLDIRIDKSNKVLKLIYIDDLIKDFLVKIKNCDDFEDISYSEVNPIYKLDLKSITEKIFEFNNSRNNNNVCNVGSGFDRKLYATYLSFIPKDNFKRGILKYQDERGLFSELIKTKDSGQFSFFTALPGVTRGVHYHDTKSEKFLVVKGNAEFKLKCIISGLEYTTELSETKLEMIDSIPGWVHQITNIGNDDLIVFVWASEIFDQTNPDTHREI